jgi:hypothetical protein
VTDDTVPTSIQEQQRSVPVLDTPTTRTSLDEARRQVIKKAKKTKRMNHSATNSVFPQRYESNQRGSSGLYQEDDDVTIESLGLVDKV